MITTSADTSTSTKACCSCGTDVAGQRRMKDSQGHYWCVPCGEADQRKRQLTSTQSVCASCRKSFAKGKLNKDGEFFFCKACLKKRTRGAIHVAIPAGARPGAAASAKPSAASASPLGEWRAVVIALAILAAFGGLAVLVNFLLI